MLVLTRKKIGDQITFPGLGIKVTVLGAGRYGIEAPDEVGIGRDHCDPSTLGAEPRDARPADEASEPKS
ncbi:MAG TPA: carbon storage regulator [Candidatus Peribacteria bacterium]|nr:carbon storage regulator [Candidatus Peribacteria bacterium]